MKKTLSLIASLTVISAACAAVLAFVNAKTADPIAKTKENNKIAAARAVMPSAAVTVEKISDDAFAGRDAAGAIAGFAVKGMDSGGYGGDIELMVGFEADRKTVVSYRKLAASETPGLGMKLVEESFSSQFAGKDGSSLKVKKDGGDIDAIASATITSRAVCKAIADACRKAGEIQL